MICSTRSLSQHPTTGAGARTATAHSARCNTSSKRSATSRATAAEIDFLERELEPAGRDPRNVEQMIDELGEAADLPLERRQFAHDAVGLRLLLGLLEEGARHEIEVKLQRGKRRSELVRGNRNQRVARAYRFLQLLQE